MGATLLTYFLQMVVEDADRMRFSLEPDIGRAASYVLDHLKVRWVCPRGNM